MNVEEFIKKVPEISKWKGRGASYYYEGENGHCILLLGSGKRRVRVKITEWEEVE